MLEQIICGEMASLPRPPDSALLEYSVNARQVLEKSLDVAAKYKNAFVGTEHLLVAMVEMGECRAAQILRRFDVDASAVHDALFQIYGIAAEPDDPAGKPV